MATQGTWYPVGPGESLASIAGQHGCTEAEVWEHPFNEPLRKRRPDPTGVGGGDSVFIPGKNGRTTAKETGPKEPSGTGPVGQGQHVVKQGECISSIAKEKGHFWETVWNDSGNSNLRTVRVDPNVLLPGDRVTIPEIRPKKEPGQTEMRHRFMRKGEPAKLAIRVEFNDRPLANCPYELHVGGDTQTGFTDPQGGLCAPVPANSREGRLVVTSEGRRFEYALQLGDMDPITEVVGVQRRLVNLGFHGVPMDGILGSSTKAALRQFQSRNGLPVNGRPDEATRSKLREMHGS